MKLEIRSETSIQFEIDAFHEGGKVETILRLDGGEWQLLIGPQQGWRHIGGRRIDWPEALKRALTQIEDVLKYPAGRPVSRDPCPHCGKPWDTKWCSVGGCPLGADL
jgi:hypothetical protein